MRDEYDFSKAKRPGDIPHLVKLQKNMKTTIQPFEPTHTEAVVDLSLRAWEPVFVSIRQAMDAEVYDAFYPEDWRVPQKEAVASVCASADTDVWVAKVDKHVAGFVAVKLDAASKMGEIYMVAVDPEHQGQGIGLALTNWAVDRMRDAGMSVAMVETGADPGHAPARAIYEKAGFGLLEVARYFKKL